MMVKRMLDYRLFDGERLHVEASGGYVKAVGATAHFDVSQETFNALIEMGVIFGRGNERVSNCSECAARMREG